MIPPNRRRPRWQPALALLALLGASPRALAAPPEAEKSAAPAEEPNTPEGTFKAFLMGMAAGDADRIRAVTLPNKDLDWLTRGQHVPAEQLDEFRKEVVDGTPIKRLEPGDEFSLPGGKTLKVKPEEVTAERVVLLQDGAPMPTRCQRVEGRWKVDARPFIAARQAADAARRKAGAKSQGPKKADQP